MRVGFLSFLISLSFCVPSFAAPSRARQSYFKAGKTKVYQVQTRPEVLERLKVENAILNDRQYRTIVPWNSFGIAGLGEVIEQFDALLVVGKKIWDLVAAGKSVANVQTDWMSVVPQSAQNWNDLSGFKGPMTYTFIVETENILRSAVAHAEYTISFNYGGSYKGKGQYISNATVIPADVWSAWMWDLNSKVTIVKPVNHGTEGDPNPGVQFVVEWKTESRLSHKAGTESYAIRGDGTVTQIATSSDHL